MEDVYCLKGIVYINRYLAQPPHETRTSSNEQTRIAALSASTQFLPHMVLGVVAKHLDHLSVPLVPCPRAA